jgi:iron complex transport system permease protein
MTTAAAARHGAVGRARARRVRPAIFWMVIWPLFVAVVVAAVAIGSAPIDWRVVASVLADRLIPFVSVSTSPADETIVWLIRLPRVLVAAVVGAGLATAGTIMQALFRNPLAEPSVTGVGPGAVFGAVLAFVLGWGASSIVLLPLSSMVSALAALLLVYGMSTRGGTTPITTLLLSGMAVGALFTALSSLLISMNILSWQVAQEIVFWMMGGLDGRTWAHVWLSVPFVAIGVVTAWASSRTLDLLLLGEETAASLGVEVESAKRLLIVTAAVLTGAAVAVAGLVGFVGLVVPHAIRLLVGPVHRMLVPAAAMAGATFVVGCDLLARTAYRPVEIRLGIVTALCGAPLFLWLVMRRLQEERA